MTYLNVETCFVVFQALFHAVFILFVPTLLCICDQTLDFGLLNGLSLVHIRFGLNLRCLRLCQRHPLDWLVRHTRYHFNYY